MKPVLRIIALPFVLLLAFGCGSDDSGVPEPEPSAAERRAEPVEESSAGGQVYQRYCLACHQADGSGVPGLNPPLRGTEWVVGDPGRLIRLVLNGLSGPIDVQGERYDNVMTPHGHLTDEQIADVLTFVRSSFGNDAPPITPDDVAAVRKHNEHEGFWDPSVLEDRVGIPSE